MDQKLYCLFPSGTEAGGAEVGCPSTVLAFPVFSEDLPPPENKNATPMQSTTKMLAANRNTLFLLVVGERSVDRRDGDLCHTRDRQAVLEWCIHRSHFLTGESFAHTGLDGITCRLDPFNFSSIALLVLTTLHRLGCAMQTDVDTVCTTKLHQIVRFLLKSLVSIFEDAHEFVDLTLKDGSFLKST